MADKQLKVVFSFNETELAKFNKLLKDSDLEAKKLEEDLKDVGKESGKAFDTANSGIDKLVTGVKAYLSYEFAKQLFNAAVAASKFAAEAEGIQSAFKNLGGSTEQLKQLSEAVGGTVSNLELMKFSVQALQKGLTFDQITKAAESLNKQANATGKSFQELSQKAIKGMKDIPSFMNEVIKKSEELGEVVGDTGDAYAKLGIAQENVTLAFGKLLNSGPVKEFLNGVADGVNDLADAINRSADPLESARKRLTEISAEADKAREGLTSRSARVRFKSGEELARLEKEWNELTTFLEGEAAKSAKKVVDAELKAKTEAEDESREAAAKLEAEKDAAAYSKAIREATEKAQKETQRLQVNSDQSAFVASSVAAGNTDLTKMFNDTIELESREKSKAEDVVKPIEEAGKSFEDSFDKALGSAEQMVTLLNGLDSDDSGFKKALTILSTITQAGSVLGLGGDEGKGLGAASTLLRLFIPLLNEGGMVPGGGPDRDSVLAGLTPGEFVTNRRATQRSPLLLDAINAGEIDDKIFMQLKQTPVIVNIDQDKIVKAIESMPQFDFYKNGSALYEFRKQNSGREATRKARISL